MKLGILGDTHGNYRWIKYALGKFNREGIDTIIQLGDFGFGLSPEQNFEKKVNLLLKNYGQHMVVVPGNHENYDLVNAAPLREDGFQQYGDNMLLAPRGHRWVWDGLSFVALGGGPSLDRTWRKSHETAPDSSFPEGMVPDHRKIFWEEEAITKHDVQKVINGGHADVMLGHDAPDGIEEIRKNVQGNPHGFQSWDLQYGDEQRKLMTKAFEAVAPEIFLHGHYHFFVNEKRLVRRIQPNGDPMFSECTVVGFSKDESNLSMGYLDTETHHVVAWDITIDFSKYGANL